MIIKTRLADECACGEPKDNFEIQNHSFTSTNICFAAGTRVTNVLSSYSYLSLIVITKLYKFICRIFPSVTVFICEIACKHHSLVFSFVTLHYLHYCYFYRLHLFFNYRVLVHFKILELSHGILVPKTCRTNRNTIKTVALRFAVVLRIPFYFILFYFFVFINNLIIMILYYILCIGLQY